MKKYSLAIILALSLSSSVQAGILDKIKVPNPLKSNSGSGPTYVNTNNQNTIKNSVCAKSGPGYNSNSEWNDCTRLEQDINANIKSAFEVAANGRADIAYGSIANAVKKAESCRAEAMTCGKNDKWVEALEKLARSAEDDFFDKHGAGLIAASKADQIPTEKYSGGNKEQYRSGIKSLWQKTYPNDKIVKVIMSGNEWKKTQTKRWNSTVNEWQYNNVDSLAAAVAVRKNDTLTIIYAAFVNKNNMNGETSYGVETKSSYSVIFVSSSAF